MNARVCVFAFIALHYVCFAGLEADIPASHRVVLPGDWTPATEMLPSCFVAIESFLKHPGSLDKCSKEDVKRISKNIEKYRVQFVGVIRDGKRVLWCNFFPNEYGSRGDRFRYWKKEVVKVSDGGAWYWQIYYDPVTNKCFGFTANGWA